MKQFKTGDRVTVPENSKLTQKNWLYSGKKGIVLETGSNLLIRFKSLPNLYIAECYAEHRSKKPKLLPFDLEKALAGEKVITRDGSEATELKNNPFKLIASVNGCKRAYTERGKEFGYHYKRNYDLFMSPAKKKTYWANIYKHNYSKTCRYFSSNLFESEQEAIDHIDTESLIKTIKIKL